MPKVLTVSPFSFKHYAANKAEQQAFKRLYDREVENGRVHTNYRDFRRDAIAYDSLNGCFRYISDGIYIGIEEDGYTHS